MIVGDGRFQLFALMELISHCRQDAGDGLPANCQEGVEAGS